MDTRRGIIIFFIQFFAIAAFAQPGILQGNIFHAGKALPYASINIPKENIAVIADSTGFFSIENLSAGKKALHVSATGFNTLHKMVVINDTGIHNIEIELTSLEDQLEEVVITGTMKEVKRMETPVPVEVYSPAFFRKNPTPSIFDALQNVNGVRPQINCNICNTGDIHINGLEGPYTMVLIDGMPIVSSLSTVYGLSGIPNALVERIEVVKGPASSLYGSEAVGGLINIITKNTLKAPAFSADVMVTSWKELSADLGFKTRVSKNVNLLTGLSYYNYASLQDHNQDNFTDVTQQHRISVFQKWNMERKQARIFTLASRFYYEDRWGGDIRWDKNFRGGDSIYGESIYTRRWELLGNYQLPVKEKVMLSFSLNDHNQDSYYGDIPFMAKQQIAFSQLTWDKSRNNHDALLGIALRYTKYDDNSVATLSADGKVNQPQEIFLPGIFVQDEIKLADRHKLLLGYRYDYNSVHGNIHTPRIAYKWSISPHDIIRINAGTGYRVVNLFTEDHAALTGSREVVIQNELKPEKTYNINVNYLKKIYTPGGIFINLDLSAWHTYFNNRITADYDTDPNKIIYDNLKGHAISKGFSANADIVFPFGLKLLAGTTLQDVANYEGGKKIPQALTEKFSGTWAVSYKLRKLHTSIDYTGNLYGPMRLPILGGLDPRRPSSQAWSLQNIQLTYQGIQKIEIYAGVKNLLNFTPNRGNPFIIARSHDPFDKLVEYDAGGQVIATATNPYALTFDTNYLYAPNQGIRGFLGVRVNIK